MNFNEMGLDNNLLTAIKEMGFTSPTPIQEQVIKLLLQGSDIIGQAQTGTGKTAAFGLPALQYCINANKKQQKTPSNTAVPYVLLLAPTRELAVQIKQELDKMSKYSKVNSVCVYGGQDIEKQLRAFRKNVDIVVATPGRALDHIKRETLLLKNVKYVVLDEADRMLDMGFIDDVAQILEQCNKVRQIALFSATMPRGVENIAYEYMNNPKTVKVSEDKITLDNIEQYFIQVDAKNRIGYLLAILKEQKPKLVVIFTRTKLGAQRLSQILQRKGYMADSLHGDMRQGSRDRAMKKFKDGELHILVATDLASRGIDVLNITHVINYDLPQDPLVYVHRIGRTGRMGLKGVSISFVFDDQMDWIAELPKITNNPIKEMVIEPITSGIRDVARSIDNQNREHRRSSGRSSRPSNRRYGNSRSSDSSRGRTTKTAYHSKKSRGGHYHGRAR